MQRLTALSVLLACLTLSECGLTRAEFAEESAERGSQQNNVQGFINHFARSPTVPCKHHYRELANYLVELANEAMARASDSQPCERKRNSELINSLLGLPKTMNDAGRK